ncbi:beta-N-acetylhexosaminidase [Opacimonas sp. LMIT016]|uniref:beta-N-acetylhexosaminidase n=2 Tax=Alteromonadaceae TaxID=72275 RepID=UPI003AACE1DE
MHPIMLDVAGYELSAEDKEILAHPLTGGVILFARNYHEPKQLSALTQAMRKAAGKPLLIATDHEGGRVQRFREGFFGLPAMNKLAFTAQPQEAARCAGQIIAYECFAHGVDLALAPVLDINGISQVIGDRAFGSSVDDIIEQAKAFIAGLKDIGMAATGKHFPGHGSVVADSHIDQAIDSRAYALIEQQDMQIFANIINSIGLDSVMPAHVIYPAVDEQPAGFSRIWLQDILRNKLGFNGVIFSDDLGMHAAQVAGDMAQRVMTALHAGCDMALVCNDRQGVIQALDNVPYDTDSLQQYSSQPQDLIHSVHTQLERHQYQYENAKHNLTKLLLPLSESES